MSGSQARRFLVIAGAIACAMPWAARAGDVDATRRHGFTEFVSSAKALLQDGTSRFESLLHNRFRALSSDSPDWLREQTWGGFDADGLPAMDELQLVVQQDRRDGTDLLTLRYPIVTFGSLRTYAGAGINQAEYYAADATDSTPDLVTRRNRHRSVGGAAELGAELRLSEQLLLNADVRWVELDPTASLLRANDGLVGADPVSVGLSLGWRFR